MLSLIVNTGAGGGRAGRSLAPVRAALGRLGLEHHVEQTSSLDHARELTQHALAASETPVAFGGDGLVAAVADAARGGDVAIGVLPGGRGNDFARSLGLPLNPVAATAVLADGEPRDIDMAAIGDRTFLGIAACGFDSDANRVANDARLVRGRMVYAYGAMRALTGWRPASFTLRIDGHEHAVYGYTVAVANAAMYGGGMRLAPDASLTDGTLDIVQISHMRKLRVLRLFPRIFSGSHVDLDEVKILQGRSVTISADRPFTVYADGDPIAVLPTTVSVLPAAVRVLVPATFTGSAP